MVRKSKSIDHGLHGRTRIGSTEDADLELNGTLTNTQVLRILIRTTICNLDTFFRGSWEAEIPHQLANCRALSGLSGIFERV